MSALPGLTDNQRHLVEDLLPGHEVLENLSWGLLDTVVLRLRHAGKDLVVKAGGPANHHIGREITAHQSVTGTLVARGRAPRLHHADRELNLLVTEWLPGELAQGTAAEHDVDVHRQAGTLLALLHAHGEREDGTWEVAARERVRGWLARPHRLDAATVRRVEEVASAWEVDRSTVVVPTHGDYQPRNWVVEGGRVGIIDFGRAAWRPAATDLVRLAAQQWRGRPDLEAAFLDGYGCDPREAQSWARMRLAEAVGTAVWAYQVGDGAFEQQGHRMLEEALRPWQ